MLAMQPTGSAYAPRFDQRTADQGGDRDMRAALQGILDRLSREAEDRVQKKQQIEKRWLEDLRQLAGIYPPDVMKDLIAGERSQLFINLTRPKTDTCSAKLSDMLFPTDDKNWGIKPSPVPSLTQNAKQAADIARQKADQANAAVTAGEDPQQHVDAGNQAAQVAGQAKAQMDEARSRAERMEAEIDDQFRQANYAVECRRGIVDGCSIGSGIIKGPIAQDDRSRRSWSKGEDGTYQLGQMTDPRPAAVWVDPWSLFPDPDALEPKDSEDWYERHLTRASGMRKLAKQPGFDKDAIRRLLQSEPKQPLPTYVAQLRQITGEASAPTGKVYHVWEFRGVLTTDELQTVCACMTPSASTEKAQALYKMADPLQEISVVLWFCDGEVIKFGLNPLDSCESLYSFFTMAKDPASIWGFGIPYQMRDPQSALNGAWRALMDNTGLSSGPQIEIDTAILEPANGKWVMEPRKIWKRKEGAQGTLADRPGFRATNIEAHQAELVGVIELAKEFIDEVTNISVIASGEQGAHVTDTAQGMAILMNAVNVIFRDMVKNFDDGITQPIVRRFYDWNMQFNPKEEIKGDYDVDARGSSVLLVREVETQNLAVLASKLDDPVGVQILKAAAIYRRWVKSMMIPADEVCNTDDEIRANAAAQGQKPDPEQMKFELQMKIAEAANNKDIMIAQMTRDTAMITLAQTRNMKIEELAADLQKARDLIDHKERAMAAEIGLAQTVPAKEAATVAGGA